MAEVIGLAASIIQIAGAGAKLSVALYNFTNSAARADQDVKDIADDVELTSNALESVGRVFESEEAGSIVSKKAIQDANNIIKKCKSVFDEVSEMVEKRMKIRKDGNKSFSMMGKLAWPMKEQRVELNRKRLESLKNSLVLLLHVLQLAQGQARGRMERSVLEEERDKIRELHQRQQDSLKSLQALENRFCHVALDDEETLRGSSTASRVPTLELMANAPVMELPPLEKPSKPHKDTIIIDLSTADDSDTSESDATMSGDDDEEKISAEELAKAADHVKKLLKRIIILQKSFGVDKKKHRKRHVHKMYIRFCRKFEPGIKPSIPEVDFGEFRAGDSFGLKDSSGTLECFDFDSFLSVSQEATPFPLLDFNLPGGQHSEPQQAHNAEAVPSTQSSQHPPLSYHDSIAPVPSSSAQTPHYPPVPSGSAASDISLDLSGQQQRPSLGQGQSAQAQQTPETVSQTWTRIQRQAQSMAQQQAQAQHQQAQAQPMMQSMPGMIQSLPSPAMPMPNRPMLPPASTSSSSMPTYSRPTIPEISQSSQSGVESSLHTQSPMLTADSTLLPQPPSANTALQDYMYQLTSLNCQERRSNPPPGQKQDGDNQLTTDRGQVDTSLSQSRKKARLDQDASPFTHDQPSTMNAGRLEAGNGTPLRGRKKGLTAEQRRYAAAMRLIGACQNCQSLKLKCDPSYPCGSCIERDAKQEELPSEACRGLKIADHTEGFLGTFENFRPPSGVPVPYIPSSGYAEPDADDSHRKESLQPNRERRVGRKRQLSSSPVSRSKLPWSSLASQQPSPDDGLEHAIQFDSNRRLRMRKDRVDHGSEGAANISSPLVKNEEITDTGDPPISMDRDIVDVLLEEWTLPVY